MAKIKIFHATMIYDSWLDKIYKSKMGLAKESFDSQIDYILHNIEGGLNSYWRKYLNNDKYELVTFITNSKPLQKKWAEEKHVVWANNNWRTEIIVAQTKEYSPNILFAHDHNPFIGKIDNLKKEIKELKLVLGWDGVKFHNTKLFEGYDLILSPLEETVNFYKNLGIDSYKFDFGFDKDILNNIIKRAPIYDCCFIGQLDTSGQHKERYHSISNLSKEINISLWTPSLGFDNLFRYYYYQLKRLLKLDFEAIKNVIRLKKINKGYAFGKQMFQILADSKIVVNKHITQAGNSAANVRLFEVTGSGACLLTDHKDNLDDFFKVGEEIVTYRSDQELIEKVKYLLSNEEERKKIANKGQKKTLATHTYMARIKQFSEFLDGIYQND